MTPKPQKSTSVQNTATPNAPVTPVPLEVDSTGLRTAIRGAAIIFPLGLLLVLGLRYLYHSALLGEHLLRLWGQL